MRKFLLSAILTSFIALATFTGASAEFFRDIIITSPNGLWTDSRAYSTLNDAISAVGSNERTIKIVSPQAVTSLTIPSNITLEFTRDGSITNSGQLTLETDSIIAPNRQIFTGSGDIDFAAGSVVKSSWFANLDTALDLTNDDTLTLTITKSETTTASMVVGDNVTLRWNSPFIITSLTGHVISNIKNIEAGNYQLFAGAGDFDFLDGTELKLSWFANPIQATTWVETEEVTILINEQADVSSDLTTSANENIKILPGGSISINTGITLTLDGDLDLKGSITGSGNLTLNNSTQLSGLINISGNLITTDINSFNCLGGTISISGTSTIGNNFNAGNYQIFTGAGAISFASGSEVKSAWFSDFETAITKIGTDEVKLIVSSASSIVNDCTINANTSLSIPSKGRILTVASTKTLTINGSFSAGLYQVFSGDGDVKFSNQYRPSIIVYPEWWTDNVSPGTTDMTSAIQAAIDSIGKTGGVELTHKYLTSSVITLLPAGLNINLFSNNGAVIFANHNGNCIDVSGSDSNHSYFTISGITLNGPNTIYPSSGYTPPSTGAGIYMTTTYHSAIRDCDISGFKYGVYMDTAIGNVFEGRTYLRFNQHGLYIAGGASNANIFNGVSFRENRLRGITITSYGSPYATANIFNNCLIETNIPYPYVSGGPGDYSDSVGVYLDSTYGNIFNGCYSENHEYAIVITGSSDKNKFIGCRFNTGLGRSDKIAIDGDACNNNLFSFCTGSGVAALTDVQIETTGAQSGNQFLDCINFNIIDSSLDTPIYVRNLQSLYGYTSIQGAHIIPPQGQVTLKGEGTGRGYIDGIGTSSATLNAWGIGEILLGNTITGATTIDAVTLERGQTVIITNYQTIHAVTIKSSTTGTSGITLDKQTDIVLTAYSDTIVLYRNNIGKVFEIGRAIKTY